MARSCGLRLGRNDFELLILEGSAKKPNVVACVTGSIPEDSEEPAAELVTALKEATKGLKVPTDALQLVADSGLAAFRSLTLPFDDKSKIEQVIKFEVESLIPQWDIDDVVVDFHVAKSTGVESTLLATVVPKEPLAALIDIATRAGLEPLEAEVESSSIVNAASIAGILTDEASQVLIHVGHTSTSIIVIDNGVVCSMRSARVGADHSDSPQRLMREIKRTVTGLPAGNPLDGIYLAGAEFPGIIGQDFEGITISPLDAFESDSLPEGTSAATFAGVFGAALTQLGATPIKASLRRDELRFAGKLERLELPLAVLALLLAAVMGIQFVVLQKEKAPLKMDMGRWYASSNVFMLGESKKLQAGYLTVRDKKIEKKVEGWTAQIAAGDLTEYQALRNIKATLASEVTALEKKLGKDTTIRKPQSAFGAATRVLAVLDSLGQDHHGYFSIRHCSGNFSPGSGSKEDHVELKLDMSFYSEGKTAVALEHWNNFNEEVQKKDWCLEFGSVRIDTFDGGGGIVVDGIRIKVDMSKLEAGDQS